MNDDYTMNMLWSYAYARNVDLHDFLPTLNVPQIRFFGDSGAHSARTLGIHIDVHDVARWAKSNEDTMTIYANLDVIGAPEQTLRNQKIMEEEYGLHPMPVFHTGEDWKYLEKYLEDGYTYIALGKLLGNSKKALLPWIAKAFHIAGDAAVFHGFGLTVWDMLVRFPFYSVDSSSWGAAFRYGQLRLFDQRTGKWDMVKLRDRKDVLAHRQLIQSYGLSLSALAKGSQDTPALAAASAEAQRRSAVYLRRIHGEVHLPPGKGYPPPSTPARPWLVRCGVERPGLNQYIASGPPKDFENASKAFQPAAGGPNIYLADTVKHQFLRAAKPFSKENP